MLRPRRPNVEWPHIRTDPSLGDQDAPRHGQERGLATTKRPHQQHHLSPCKLEAHPLKGLHLARRPRRVISPHSIASTIGSPHRVNAVAGSMRTTCMIAEIAQATHIAIVSRNKLAINNQGVITTGSAVSAVALTIKQAGCGCDDKSDDRAQQRLDDNDGMNVRAGRSDRAQRRELVEMFLGIRIKSLRDDDAADNHAEQGAGDEGGARRRFRRPERAAALAKFVGRQYLGFGKRRLQSAANIFNVSASGKMEQQIGGLVRRRPRIGTRPIQPPRIHRAWS